MKRGLGDEVIRRFSKSMAGENFVLINCNYNNGRFIENREGSSLKGKRIDYLALLLILCDKIRGIGCLCNILFNYRL